MLFYHRFTDLSQVQFPQLNWKSGDAFNPLQTARSNFGTPVPMTFSLITPPYPNQFYQ
ncbi:hypothetical protein AALO_G00307440 [Alosa alosa]|uniref:Uncharacterized protein n=1 Tax=Alosa alosa TaxID=278164 RepID=A0AAV6FDD6_9TELE|nr:hypothetical protein AALO_G00307440 [Alosa alosa]